MLTVTNQCRNCGQPTDLTWCSNECKLEHWSNQPHAMSSATFAILSTLSERVAWTPMPYTISVKRLSNMTVPLIEVVVVSEHRCAARLTERGRAAYQQAIQKGKSA